MLCAHASEPAASLHVQRMHPPCSYLGIPLLCLCIACFDSACRLVHVAQVFRAEMCCVLSCRLCLRGRALGILWSLLWRRSMNVSLVSMVSSKSKRPNGGVCGAIKQRCQTAGACTLDLDNSFGLSGVGGAMVPHNLIRGFLRYNTMQSTVSWPTAARANRGTVVECEHRENGPPEALTASTDFLY